MDLVSVTLVGRHIRLEPLAPGDGDSVVVELWPVASVGRPSPSPLLMSNRSSATGGIGLGTVIAAILSWSANHSVLWAVVHGILGWLYVAYYVFIR